MRKRRRRSMRGDGRLEQQEFLELDALAQRRHVIDHRGRELFGFEPHASESMALRENQQRIEPRLLDGGAEQQRQVEAGRQPAVGNLRRPADFLAAVLETGRRQRVVQAHRRDRAPDCRCQLPGAFGAGLVAIERRVLVVSAQHLGRPFEHALHRGVVRLHECGHHVGQLGQAAPLVAGQQVDRPVEPEQLFVSVAATTQRKSDRRLFGLRQS